MGFHLLDEKLVAVAQRHLRGASYYQEPHGSPLTQAAFYRSRLGKTTTISHNCETDSIQPLTFQSHNCSQVPFLLFLRSFATKAEELHYMS